MFRKIALPFQSWRQFYFLLINREERKRTIGYDVWRAIYLTYGNPMSYLGPDPFGKSWPAKIAETTKRLSKRSQKFLYKMIEVPLTYEDGSTVYLPICEDCLAGHHGNHLLGIEEGRGDCKNLGKDKEGNIIQCMCGMGGYVYEPEIKGFKYYGPFELTESGPKELEKKILSSRQKGLIKEAIYPKITILKDPIGEGLHWIKTDKGYRYKFKQKDLDESFIDILKDVKLEENIRITSSEDFIEVKGKDISKVLDYILNSEKFEAYDVIPDEQGKYLGDEHKKRERGVDYRTTEDKEKQPESEQLFLFKEQSQVLDKILKCLNPIRRNWDYQEFGTLEWQKKVRRKLSKR